MFTREDDEGGARGGQVRSPDAREGLTGSEGQQQEPADRGHWASARFAADSRVSL